MNSSLSNNIYIYHISKRRCSRHPFVRNFYIFIFSTTTVSLPPSRQPIGAEPLQEGKSDGEATEQEHQVGNGVKRVAFAPIGIPGGALFGTDVLGLMLGKDMHLLFVVAEDQGDGGAIRSICLIITTLRNALALLRHRNIALTLRLLLYV